MKTLRFILVLFAIASAASAFGQERPKKKLIELGWDIPTTRYVRDHWREMEQNAPFDGIIYDLVGTDPDGTTCASQSLFTASPWERKWFASCVDDLNSCSFTRYRDNFIRVNFYPAPFDWSDDDAWKNVCGKMAICAWVARETHSGLCFDFESYGSQMFYYDQNSERTFEESKALARRRGAEACKAIVGEYPEVVILCLWLNSINLAAGRADDSDEVLRRSAYGLLPAFINGMLDEVAPETKLVDGCESGYYMNGAAQYDRAACDMLLATGPAARLIAPENRQKYRSQVQAGFGFYLDMYSNPEGSAFYRGPEPGETRFERLVANLNAELNASDEYVWVYGEQKRWWKPESAKSDDEWTSWEEALPGITDLLLELSDPVAAIKALEARVSSDPNIKNLVTNGDFSRVDASGKPEGWGSWQIETHATGEFTTVDGAAALKGMSNGCYIGKITTKPGETYFISGKTLSTKKGYGSFRVRWQDANEKWVAEPLDVFVYPESEKDENGWHTLSGRAVTPEGAYRLVLLLSSYGDVPDGTVLFDDVKIYNARQGRSDD